MTPGRGEGEDSTMASVTAAANRIRERGPKKARDDGPMGKTHHGR